MASAAVVPQLPSLPLCTHTVACERTELAALTRSTALPVSDSASVACPEASVVALAGPAVTVAPLAGEGDPLALA